jgi:3'-phosphoadenosine 5'-phosphosulfate sulfotransferase
MMMMMMICHSILRTNPTAVRLNFKCLESLSLLSICTYSSYSGQKLAELYEELQTTDTTQHLVTHFEGAVSSLLQDVKKLYEDNKKMEDMFARYEFFIKNMKHENIYRRY